MGPFPAHDQRTGRPAGRGWPAVLAVACWLLALTGVAVIVGRGFAGRMVDLLVYRAGAAAILHGSSLYGLRSVIGLRFTYPPLAALLAVPLRLLPLQLARLAWVPMVYVPLAVAVWLGFRPLLERIGRFAPAVFALVFGACAFLLPVREEMYLGQIDMFLVALCLLDCTTPRPRWPRGALIGLATAIKLVPGVFIVYLLITRQRRAAAVAALWFAAVTAAAFVIAPRDSVTYWTSAAFDTGRLGGNAAAANQSLRGMLLRAFLPGHPPALIWPLAAVAVAAAGFAAARSCWQRGDDMAAIAITGLLAAVLSPVAWIHHLCWVVVAIGVLLGTGRSWRRCVAAAAAFAVLLTMLPIWAQADLITRRVAELPGQLAEDSFGLIALGLIAALLLAHGPEPDPAGSGAVPAEHLEPAGS
jgi:alpha-1,2-mannosyltransferase